MANAVATFTKPAGVSQFAEANRRVVYRDLTIDTGNYVQASGITVNASDFGLKSLDFLTTDGVATNGTAGATANPVGFVYATDRRSATMYVYESGASGAALGAKTDAEAFAANWTVRLRAEGR